MFLLVTYILLRESRKKTDAAHRAFTCHNISTLLRESKVCFPCHPGAFRPIDWYERSRRGTHFTAPVRSTGRKAGTSMKNVPADFRVEALLRQRQWTEDGIPVLTLSLSLPFCRTVLPDRRLRRMNRCFENFARCYERYCERFLLPQAKAAFREAAGQSRPFCPWQAEARYHTALQSPSVWSLVIETEERCETGIFLRRRGDSWDLCDGYPLSLSDFFPGEPFPLRRIRRSVREELSAKTEGALLRPDWKTRLRTAAKRENFYLTEAGLCFFYPQFALGNASLGIPTFLLPWDGAGPVPPAGLSSAAALDKSESSVLS